MKLNDVVKLGIKGISERKVRTALTVLTVVIGIAAIVSLVSLVSGISASISKSLESIGPTTLFLVPGRSTIFTGADVAEIESFPNVSSVVPGITLSANITENGQQTAVTLIGINNYSLSDAIGGVNLLAPQRHDRVYRRGLEGGVKARYNAYNEGYGYCNDYCSRAYYRSQRNAACDRR